MPHLRQSSAACVGPAAVICPSLMRLVSWTAFTAGGLLYSTQQTFHCISAHISILDEATGKGVFQGPSEADPVTTAAHIAGLSALHCVF